MQIDGKEITTIELEEMFYQGPDNLKKIQLALSEEFAFVEDGDNILMSYITDNIYQADKLLNERTGVHGILVRALEIADAALDYWENRYLAELKKENDGEEKAKKLTDSVLKAQAAVKVSPYRRFRSYIRGYVTTCEKSMASLRTSVSKCQAEAYLAQRASYKNEDKGEN